MCPGGASFTPGAGSPLGRRGEGTGLRSNLFPCAQGPRIPAPRLGAGPALPSSPPTSGHLQGSTVGDADRAPIALHPPPPPPTSARGPRRGAPGPTEPQSAGAGPLGRRGRGGKPDPRSQRSRPSCRPRRGEESASRVSPLSPPCPPSSPPPARSGRPAAQLRRELSSPKLQEMFSQVVAVEASFMCVCVCVCVCIRAHALGRGSALGGEVRGRPVISQKPDSSLCGRCKGTLRQNLFSLVTERVGSPRTWWTWTCWSRFPEAIVCLLSTAVL